MSLAMLLSIDPIALSIGPLEIRWYGVSYVVGIVLAWFYVRHLIQRHSTCITNKTIDDFVIWATVAIIISGRVGYLLFYHPHDLLNDPLSMFYIWEPGRSFHGALIGVMLVTVWYCLKRSVPIFAFSDLLASAAPIGLFFGRIANFINGELYGRVTDAPWGVVFPAGGPLPRHPSQLYEAALEGFVLFFALFALERFTHLRARRPGLLTAIFFVGYGIARVFVELFRQPDAHLGFFAGGTTMGQILSTPVLLFGIILAWHVINQPKLPELPKEA